MVPDERSSRAATCPVLTAADETGGKSSRADGPLHLPVHPDCAEPYPPIPVSLPSVPTRRWPAVPERHWFWMLQIAGWTLITPMMFLATRNAFNDPKQAAVLTAIRILSGFTITSLILRPIYRGLRSGHWPLLVQGMFIFLLCGLIAFADVELSDALANRLLGAGILTWTPWIAQAVLYTRWMVFLVWSLLYFGLSYWRSIQMHQMKLLEKEAANRQSELQLLRAQINPHFLFNALNTTLAEKEDPAKVELIVQALAEYLRFSMTQGDSLTPITVELEALQNYLRVEKCRFEEDLEIEVDVAPDAAGTPVPTSLVQPLIENAIKFGRLTSPLPLRVRIGARRDASHLHLEVANSGAWVPEGTGTGIGLANLRRRLSLLVGDTATLTTSVRDGWVHAAVHVPVPATRGNR